jgi:hypothetical protein
MTPQQKSVEIEGVFHIKNMADHHICLTEKTYVAT